MRNILISYLLNKIGFNSLEQPGTMVEEQQMEKNGETKARTPNVERESTHNTLMRFFFFFFFSGSNLEQWWRRSSKRRQTKRKRLEHQT